MPNQIISDLYEELLQGLADLNQMKKIVERSFIKELEFIKRSEDIVNRDAYLFNNALTGQLEKYAFRDTTKEDLERLTFWHQNSQYCWLLMSAYERFEVFIKQAYKELAGRDFSTLNKTLIYFSDTFPKIKSAENKNPFEINLRVAVHLVAKMRHTIAHNQGSVSDISLFVNKVINGSGISTNRKDHEEFVSQFIIENKIYILERPVVDDSRLYRTHDMYRILISYLISYAHLINHAAE